MPVRTDSEMIANQQQQQQFNSQIDSFWSDSSMSMQSLNLDEDDWRMTFLELTPTEVLSGLDTFDSANMDFSDLLTAPSSPKYQIRHHDCMWSGTCVDKSHPSKKKGALNSCPASTTSTTASKSTQNQDTLSATSTTTSTTTQITTNSQPQSSIKAQSNNETPKLGPAKHIMTNNLIKTIMCKDKIPAGRSLLINSRNNSAKTQLTTKMNCMDKDDAFSMMTSSMNSLRPDTPLTLGDDAPEFKHHIDLTPCPSSNRMKFNDPNSSKIINMLKEHLEDTSNGLNDNNFLINYRTSNGQRTSTTDLNEILTDITFLSDYEDLADDVDIDDETMDDGSIDGNYASKHHNNNYNNNNNNINKSSKIQKLHTTATKSNQQSAVHQKHQVNSQHEYMGDHSYTLPKNSPYDMRLLGVQTPSDSEEEIDVVSIGEKTLPTNPSARDRRALQTTVAHKIARMGKNSSNHQRRRVSDDESSSISSTSSSLSSKGSTPVKLSSPASYVSSNSNSIVTGSSGVSRKRSHNSKDNNNNDSHESIHHSKKYRSQNTKKQQRLSNAKAAAAAAAAAANKIEDTDEAETIEKRNLHNNMERQRRIGLKNLFEELKCQIPSLKDKERAPKVNILREAAAFCNKLKRDDDLHNELGKKQNRLLARVRSLKASIATSQRKNY